MLTLNNRVNRQGLRGLTVGDLAWLRSRAVLRPRIRGRRSKICADETLNPAACGGSPEEAARTFGN